MKWLDDILEFELIDISSYNLQVADVLAVLALVLAAVICHSLIGFVLKRREKRLGEMDTGRKDAVMKIVKYFLTVIVVVMGIEMLGFDPNVLIASSAALFVGLGFGLQDAFKDLISGIILLFEGTISKGDVIEVEGLVGTVQEIKLRTTAVRTRDDIYVLVPNHKFVSESVINWSESSKYTRFHVEVGVAYGTDTGMIHDLLKEIANNHERVLKKEETLVLFEEFGDSSLNFSLHFWTQEIWDVLKIKSEIRMEIDRQFKEKGISIPFPQRDLHLRTSEVELK